MDEHQYTGSKIKNQFTAYIFAQIRGARQNYIRKMLRVSGNEVLEADLSTEEAGIPLEEKLDMEYREEILMKEAYGGYPDWTEMKDRKLVDAIMLLSEEERNLIYQHVFEEKGFKEMSRINALPEHKVKGVYYYAIRKIRKWTGGDKS